MTTLLAIDPSTTCTGLAVFRYGKLAQTFAVKYPKGAPSEPVEKARRMVWAVGAVLDAQYLTTAATSVVIEWPEVYRGSEVDANDLFVVAAVGLGIAARCTHAGLTKYQPKQWTGTIPKTVDGKLLKKHAHASPRAKRIIARLDAAELAVFHAAETHDEIDAIGLGLHHVLRGITQRHRVYPGAT